MQEVFISKRDQLQEDLLKEENKKKIADPKKEDFYETVLIEETKAEDQHHEEKQHTSFKRVKSFKEMDIKERLDYLVHFPKVLPPVPCLFRTEKKNLQGYLQEYQDDQVTIQFHDQTTETISVHDLKDIMMIGIKK
jgi:calcineurin-like phosphoesterase family protein